MKNGWDGKLVHVQLPVLLIFVFFKSYITVMTMYADIKKWLQSRHTVYTNC